jgi:putative phosphoribosyl transferase
MFKDRHDAAVQLAARLAKYKNGEGVVLGIPRGGVPMGYEIAVDLGFTLDLALTKKIGHPQHPEFAVGSVTLQGYSVSDYAQDVPEAYIEGEVARIQGELRRKQQLFVGNRPLVDVRGKTVIIVDDGIATGNTIMAAAEGVRSGKPGKIVIAVPVAPPQVIPELEKVADEVVALLQPPGFRSVGQYYDDFEQVEDSEVIAVIKKFDRMYPNIA